MPTYSIKNSTTDEITDYTMSYDDIKKMIDESNGELSMIIGAPKIISGRGSQGIKVDNGFREVMSKIKSNHPKNTIKDF